MTVPRTPTTTLGVRTSTDSPGAILSCATASPILPDSRLMNERPGLSVIVTTERSRLVTTDLLRLTERRSGREDREHEQCEGRMTKLSHSPSRRPNGSGSALDLHVPLAFVLEHPFVRIADVDPALLGGILDELLPVLEDLLHLLLHVLGLPLEQREVGNDGSHPGLESGRFQRRLLVELYLRRLGRRPASLSPCARRREGNEGKEQPNNAPQMHAAPRQWRGRRPAADR